MNSLPVNLMLTLKPVKRLSDLSFPLYAYPKRDGLRATAGSSGLTLPDGGAVPNQSVQNLFKRALDAYPWLRGIDCTLSLMPTQSGDLSLLMDADYVSQSYYLFIDDRKYGQSNPYFVRYKDLAGNLESPLIVQDGYSTLTIAIEKAVKVFSPKGLFNYQESQLAKGFDGIILRQPHKPYQKCHRLVLSPVDEAEGTLIGIERIDGRLTLLVDTFDAVLRIQDGIPDDAIGKLREGCRVAFTYIESHSSYSRPVFKGIHA